MPSVPEPHPSAQPHSVHTLSPTRAFCSRYKIGDGDVVQFDELQKTDQNLGLLIQTAGLTAYKAGVVRAPHSISQNAACMCD